MRIRQSLCYMIYQPDGMSLDEYMKALARIGFAAVEFWGREPQHDEVIAKAKQMGD